MLLEPFEDAKFLGMGLGAGDLVGVLFASALEAELDVIKAGGESCAHMFDNVGTSQRFATREIGLEDAELSGFLEDAGPYFCGELVGTGLQFERIRTVDAMEWAAVGEFRDEGQRIGDRGHIRRSAPAVHRERYKIRNGLTPKGISYNSKSSARSFCK